MGTNSPLDWIRGESGIEIPVEQKAPSTAAIQSPKEPAPEKRPADSSIPFEPPPADPQAGDANTAVRGQNEETAEAESRPWWDPLVVTPNRFQPEYWNLGVNELVWYFVQNSPRLRSIQLIGQSSQPAIPESLAEFDPTLFVESNFTRLNDPVGNTLTTGGADRFRDNNWTTRAGLRRKFHTGASLETYQRLGMQTNNSDFFVPEKQGSAYLAINFTQPLLNGRGQLYNDSLIAIAQLESETAAQLAEEKIQTELLDLVKNYWKLYSARAVWIQKQKNADRAVEIYRELSSRKDFDVSQTQLFRAKAAVETRRAELIQARNDIRNIEARISATLGIDLARQRFEIVPKQGPVITLPEVDRGDAIVTAISNRPEILQAGKKVTIEATKTQRTQHELMPVLDLILGTYVSGLNDNFEFINAFGRQFSDGAPGYSAALKFEVPIYRRAAQARLDRQMLRWQAVTAEFQDRILQVESEVDIAVRNVQTSYQRLVARIVATESARAEMDSQRKRLELSLADGENFGNSLNFLLDSQDRLTNQENLLAQAQADYMISWVSLKKAMGTLVLIQSRK